MRVVLNGDPVELPPVTTVADLLAGRSTAGVAVAVNRMVVPRSGHDRRLTEGDEVDIVTAVQGG
ncbi:MAG: sulfur carrier protein ThiS [Marmoricola sp.]